MGQLDSPLQAFCPVHVTSHLHELVQVMLPPQAPVVRQSTWHGPVPGHEMALHAPADEHVTSQPSSPQVTELQLSVPPQVMSQKNPAGHCTEPPLVIAHAGVACVKSQLAQTDGHIIELEPSVTQ